MERDKAVIPVAGVPMLKRVADAVAAVCTEVIVVGEQAGREELELPDNSRWISDTMPGRGPLGGVHAGLAAASHDLVFAVSCDSRSSTPGSSRLCSESCRRTPCNSIPPPSLESATSPRPCTPSTAALVSTKRSACCKKKNALASNPSSADSEPGTWTKPG